MPRNYSLNVDVCSTQVSNPLKKIGERLGAAFITLPLLVIIGGCIETPSQERKREAEEERLERVRAKPLAPNIYKIVKDHEENFVRYQRDWEGDLVTYSGRIKDIHQFSFSFESPSAGVGFVSCEFDNSQAGKVADLNEGSFARVTGKVRVRYSSANGLRLIYLDDCKFA